MPSPSLFPDNMIGWWETCKKELVKEQRRSFDALFIYMAWGIWLQRNGRIFNNKCNTVAQVVDSIIDMCKQFDEALNS